MYKYDIALSYASEQESYVASVRTLLELKGLSVYFAPAPGCQENLIGADMLAKFYEVFHDQCLLMAAFVSHEYLQKHWTMEEAAVGRMRSREEKRNCLIPVYFGDARLPNFSPNINHLTADMPAAEVAHYLAEAVRSRKDEVRQEDKEPARVQFAGQTSDSTHTTINITGNPKIVQAGTITGSNIQCSNGGKQ